MCTRTARSVRTYAVLSQASHRADGANQPWLSLNQNPKCIHIHTIQAFIETGESNWCRLIDEIRRTDGLRHDAAYIDFAPGEWRRRMHRMV